jgi:hypothetical protein
MSGLRLSHVERRTTADTVSPIPNTLLNGLPSDDDSLLFSIFQKGTGFNSENPGIPGTAKGKESSKTRRSGCPPQMNRPERKRGKGAAMRHADTP